jgi:hypothetical protein
VSIRAHYSERPRRTGPTVTSLVRHDIDVLIEEAGTIFVFQLVTARAEAWVRLRSDRGWQRLFGALVVPHSQAEALVHSMRAEGLRVWFPTAHGKV